MRISRNKHDGFDPRILIAAGLAIPLMIALLHASNTYADVFFLRAHQDRQTYAKNPAIYEQVLFPPHSGQMVYVERRVSLRIGNHEIESVLVEKSQGGRDLQKAVEEAGRLLGKGGKQEDRPPPYTITFSLKEKAAMKQRDFVKQHDRDTFAVRFDNETLALATVLSPFEGRNVSLIGLPDDVVKRLKEILSPINAKVIWK